MTFWNKPLRLCHLKQNVQESRLHMHFFSYINQFTSTSIASVFERFVFPQHRSFSRLFRCLHCRTFFPNYYCYIRDMNDKNLLLVLFVLMVAALPLASADQRVKIMDLMGPMSRRFDCSSFCRATGYHGVMGGCRCGFILFAKRTSSRPRHFVPPIQEPRFIV